MNLRHGSSSALDEGLLVRFLHGELDPPAMRAITGHAASCDACRATIESLRTGMERASRAIRSASWDGPAEAEWNAVLANVRASAPPRSRTSRRRIAAGWIIALAAAASLASAPVRAWIAERWAVVAGRPDAPANVQSAADIAFKPAGTTVDIGFDHLQTSGSLTIRFTDAERVTVGVSDGGTERITVRRSAVRVANEPTANASWTSALSAGVRTVSIRVGAAGQIRLERNRGIDTFVVDLATGAVRNGDPRDEQ